MTALTIVTPPAVTPLSLDEVKAHLRVATNDQDALITTYLRAATDFIDGEWGFLGRALVTQTWRLTLDGFPTGGGGAVSYFNPYSYWGWNFGSTNMNGQIKIPLPPLQSVTQIEYDDPNGNVQTVNAGDFFVDTQSEPGWIVPQGSKSWPSTLDAINTVRIDFVAGYPADSSSPPDLA